MFYYSKVPLLRLLLPFVLGVIAVKQLNVKVVDWVFIGLVTLVGLTILIVFFFQKKSRLQFSNRWLFGFLATLGLFLAGISYSAQYQEKLAVTNLDSSGQVNWIAEVNSVEDNQDSSYNYQVKVLCIQNESLWVDNQFEVLVFSKKPNIILEVGDVVSASGYLNLIEGPLNPKQFNFKKFSANRGIFYRTFEDQFYQFGVHKSISSMAAKYRNVLTGWYSKMGIKNNELAVLTALTLGDKSRLSNDLKSDYASAGAMHILAVSGLHVGIIYLLFSQLFKRFDKKVWQRIIQAILLLAVIWAYALLTGLSVSAQRAACMFSFIIISSAIKRHSNIINSIAGSAFLLILINPNIVFELGFQLSYSAVVGIVLIHPAIYPLFTSKYWLIDKVWSLTVVSFAAQLATLPLSLFYFHQFPNWFLMVNLFVIPLAFVIVSGSIVLGVVWAVFQHDFYLAEVLSYTLEFLNSIISLSQELPFSTTNGVWLSNFSIGLLFLAIVTFIYFIVEKRTKSFVIFLSFLAVILIVESYHNLIQTSKNFVGIYAFDNLTMSFVNGLRAEIFVEKENLNDYEKKVVEDHLQSEGVKEWNWVFPSDTLVEAVLFDVVLMNNNLLISGMNHQYVVLNYLTNIDMLMENDFIFLLTNEKLKLDPKLVENYSREIVFLPKIKPWSQMYLDFEKVQKVFCMSRDGYFQRGISK